jgi:TonB family protein
MALLAAWSVYQLWRAYSQGMIRGRGVDYNRRDNPIRFWMTVVACLIFPLLMIVYGALLVDRTWLRPGLDHYSHVYPRQAQRENVESRVILRCKVAPSYRLRDCTVGWEERPGYGFGQSALQVAASYTLPEKDRARTQPGQTINFPVAFKMPSEPSAPAAPGRAAPSQTPPAPPSS